MSDTEILVDNGELTLIRTSSKGDIHVVTAPLGAVQQKVCVAPADAKTPSPAPTH